MANHHDLSSHHGEATFNIPGFSYSHKKGWRSLSVSKGIHFAAHDLVFLTHAMVVRKAQSTRQVGFPTPPPPGKTFTIV